jgi:hypothetical protein
MLLRIDLCIFVILLMHWIYVWIPCDFNVIVNDFTYRDCKLFNDTFCYIYLITAMGVSTHSKYYWFTELKMLVIPITDN